MSYRKSRTVPPLPDHPMSEQSYAGRNVLVTGAGGFIGSHLVEALALGGANVTALIRYNSSSSWGKLEENSLNALRATTVIMGNIEDSEFVRTHMAGKDVVFHLAALIAIPYSYIAPRSYLRTNIEGTLNVLEAARSASVARVVHTSTSECYGTAIYTPIDENHPLQGQSPYSASKIGSDKLVESYWRSFQLPVVTLRPFNTFGPRQSARAFIPTIISQALSQPQIHLGSLTPVRDLTFVADTVAGFLAAGLAPNVEGETINLGVGQGFTVGDVATRILSLLDLKLPIVEDAERIRPQSSEVFKLISNNTKAGELLKWSPAASLESGLTRTIEYVRNNITKYRSEAYSI